MQRDKNTKACGSVLRNVHLVNCAEGANCIFFRRSRSKLYVAVQVELILRCENDLAPAFLGFFLCTSNEINLLYRATSML